MRLIDEISKKIKTVKIQITPTSLSNRAEVQKQEFNLNEVSQLASIECYFSRSIIKKETNIFKEGYYIKAKKIQAVKYIKERLAEFEFVSDLSFDELLKQTAHELITFQNAFILKIRNPGSSSVKKSKDRFGKPLKPIAALQLLPTARVLPIINNGTLEKYELVDANNKKIKDYNKEDILHIHSPRLTGSFLAMPDVIPIVEDILSLRRIEENVETIVYRHATPFLVIYIGNDDNPAQIVDSETGETEIDVAAKLIENTKPGEALVLPHRYKVDTVGNKKTAMDLTIYLEHFKKRVFAGLGMSSYDFGESDSANDSLGKNLSKAFIDTCKNIQSILTDGFNKLFTEILLDKFSTDVVFDLDSRVSIAWNEIDPDRKTREENATVQLFVTNIIDRKEARSRINIEGEPDDSLTFTALTGTTGQDASSANKQTKSKVSPSNQYTNNSKNGITYSYLKNTNIDVIAKKLLEDYNFNRTGIGMVIDYAKTKAEELPYIVRDKIVNSILKSVLEQKESKIDKHKED